jgi:uncharacterized phiE125 gp8 family phage protein
MDGWLKVVTEPAEEPVSVAEVKEHCRISVAEDDTLLEGYIASARQAVEDTYTYRSLVTRTYDYYLQGWPSGLVIKLPKPPLVSVTSVTYTDTDGTAHTLSADDYHVDTASEPGRIVLAYDASWPTETLQTSNPIVIRYVAGYGDAADVPEWAKWAIKVMTADRYENREAVTVAAGYVATQLPRFVTDHLLGRRARTA